MRRRIDISDLLFGAGLVLVGAGLWWSGYPPVALIVVGAVLTALGIWSARR